MEGLIKAYLLTLLSCVALKTLRKIYWRFSPVFLIECGTKGGTGKDSLNGNIIWVFGGSLMPIYIILTVVYVWNLVNEGNNTSQLSCHGHINL